MKGVRILVDSCNLALRKSAPLRKWNECLAPRLAFQGESAGGSMDRARPARLISPWSSRLHCSWFGQTMWTSFVLLVLLIVTDVNCSFAERICLCSKCEQKGGDCRKYKNNKNRPRVLVLAYFLGFRVMVLSISICIFRMPGEENTLLLSASIGVVFVEAQVHPCWESFFLPSGNSSSFLLPLWL